jgi:hypothetical protein
MVPVSPLESSKPELTVVAVEALSYSGTTWLNLVLGSHPKAFALGPPWRVWKLREHEFRGANLVWGDDDTFWTGFHRTWDRNENFLIALGRHAGATHIILDNPSPEFRAEVMTHPSIEICELRYVRDGRAISSSFARKNPELKYLDTILPTGWLYHSFQNFSRRAIDDVSFCYENCIANPIEFLERVGRCIGLTYTSDALRFWEYDHHITWGNPGTIGLLRVAKGRHPGSFDGVEFYGAQFEKLLLDPLHGFRDQRWSVNMSRENLFDFDLVLGEQNANLGYHRDVFTISELSSLVPSARARLQSGQYDDLPIDRVTAYISSCEQRLVDGRRDW